MEKCSLPLKEFFNFRKEKKIILTAFEKKFCSCLEPPQRIKSQIQFTHLLIRGGVLEDVLGLEDVLEDTFSSPWPWPWPRRSSPWPWPWPRSLKSSKIALSSARGQHYFLNSWNFVGKRQKHCRKFASTLFFVFLTWSKGAVKGRGAGGPIPFSNWKFTNDKTVTKKPIVSSVSVSF